MVQMAQKFESLLETYRRPAPVYTALVTRFSDTNLVPKMLNPGTRAFKLVSAQVFLPSVANTAFARSYLPNENRRVLGSEGENPPITLR